ncbi:MAG: precorrin-4 C(11)-methyltransferase [Clostridium sp.]
MIEFVGAGPGAVDLITVRGMRIIENADVIIYAGSLVNKEILNYRKEGAMVYNSASMTLDEVIDVMALGYREGKKVVRVHTGDPAIYGAIKEQMDRLDREGIEYRVTPGVSSLFAAAAALKIEYTLPSVSQTVIITRAEGRTKVPEGESIKSLAQHRATMAIFLSTGLLESLEKNLVEGGYSPTTKAAIVYKASWDDEKKFICTVNTLYETAKNNNITKTALILVGDFLEGEYELSKLYDPGFAHEFREATI